MRDKAAGEIRKMLEAGVIEPTTSEWAPPIVLVPKKDGSVRFCVDNRHLNVKTVADAYPLQRIDDFPDFLGDSQIFTTLSCNAGYWQVPVAPEDRDKTTFTSYLGTYRYVRMPARRITERARNIPTSSRYHPERGPMAYVLDLPRRCYRVLEERGDALTTCRRSSSTATTNRCNVETPEMLVLPAESRLPGSRYYAR